MERKRIAVTVADAHDTAPRLLNVGASDASPTNAGIVLGANQFALTRPGISGASIAVERVRE